MVWSSSSRRSVPTNRSATPFCQGELGAVRTSVVPIPFTRCRNSPAKMLVGWRRVIGECFDNLLRGPSGGGAIEVRDLAATVQQDDKYVEQTEGRRRYDEKVDRDELGEVVLEERSPRLRGWPWAMRHKPGNSALRNVESELEEFPVDTRCTPAWEMWSSTFPKLCEADGYVEFCRRRRRYALR